MNKELKNLLLAGTALIALKLMNKQTQVAGIGKRGIKIKQKSISGISAIFEIDTPFKLVDLCWGNAKRNLTDLTYDEIESIIDYLSDLYYEPVDMVTINDIIAYEFDELLIGAGIKEEGDE